LLNGADHFTETGEYVPGEGVGDLYVAFSDNLYPASNPLLALQADRAMSSTPRWSSPIRSRA
jgi:hypothetical protein